MKLLIVIPTYNEIQNIEVITTRILNEIASAEILVVDDNSNDGTITILEKLSISQSRFHFLIRPQKTGLGDAYRAGFHWALSHGFDTIAQMDADGSHRVEDLKTLISHIGDIEVIIGSRWVSGGEIKNWPFSRYLLSRLGNVYGRIMLRIPIHDATAGFRIYSSNAIQVSRILESNSQGYVFQLENSIRIVEASLSIKEIPITFIERQFGESKMSRSIVKEAILKVTFWGLRGRLFKKKIFIK